jgi:hypothetical protein
MSLLFIYIAVLLYHENTILSSCAVAQMRHQSYVSDLFGIASGQTSLPSKDSEPYS